MQRVQVSLGGRRQARKPCKTVLKLYAALKKNNIRELWDILRDDGRCVCNFFSSFQPFNGKQEVLKFFNNLITFLGNNFEFDARTTLHEGLQVGVSWRLEWKKSHVPLGKGFSLYILQVYHGKEHGNVHGTAPPNNRTCYGNNRQDDLLEIVQKWCAESYVNSNFGGYHFNLYKASSVSSHRQRSRSGNQH